jgi:hypothetical protein
MTPYFFDITITVAMNFSCSLFMGEVTLSYSIMTGPCTYI